MYPYQDTMRINRYLLSLTFCIFCPFITQAQEEHTAVYQQGKRYIDIRIKSLNKTNEHVAGQQEKLLCKLSKQEKRYSRKLKKQDSAGYARYQQQPFSYDSISKLSKNREDSQLKQIANRPNVTVDSLKTIQKFITDKIHLQGNSGDVAGYDDKLNGIKSADNYNDYIDRLIGQRTNSLKSINSQNKGKVAGFKGIDKKVFYSKQKLRALKDINEEPSKLEEEALEVLQGTEGFEQALQNQNPNSLQSLAGKGATTSDLEKMGFQTKRQMQAKLQNKFGNNLGGLQQNMGKQITDHNDKLKELEKGKNTIKHTKASAQQLRHADKPSFKVNSMRGMPLRKRIEKQFNWQTIRATIDGKPAMLQLAVMAGFRHTPRLTYGAGLATAVGLGKSWQQVKITFEGLGVRTFAEYKMVFGISMYAGYERMFKEAVFTGESNLLTENRQKQNSHNTTNYHESVLMGLTKTYRINEKWNGSLQVLYDIWWKEKGLRSPVQLRIATLKN